MSFVSSYMRSASATNSRLDTRAGVGCGRKAAAGRLEGRGSGHGTQGLPGVTQRKASSGSSRSHLSIPSTAAQGGGDVPSLPVPVVGCFPLSSVGLSLLSIPFLATGRCFLTEADGIPKCRYKVHAGGQRRRKDGYELISKDGRSVISTGSWECKRRCKKRNLLRYRTRLGPPTEGKR